MRSAHRIGSTLASTPIPTACNDAANATPAGHRKVARPRSAVRRLPVSDPGE